MFMFIIVFVCIVRLVALEGNWYKCNLLQGMVDGSASKPAIVQDTDYIVEKTYNLASYLGPFGAYFKP